MLSCVKCHQVMSSCVKLCQFASNGIKLCQYVSSSFMLHQVLSSCVKFCRLCQIVSTHLHLCPLVFIVSTHLFSNRVKFTSLAPTLTNCVNFSPLFQLYPHLSTKVQQCPIESTYAKLYHLVSIFVQFCLLVSTGDHFVHLYPLVSSGVKSSLVLKSILQVSSLESKRTLEAPERSLSSFWYAPRIHQGSYVSICRSLLAWEMIYLPCVSRVSLWSLRGRWRLLLGVWVVFDMVDAPRKHLASCM